MATMVMPPDRFQAIIARRRRYGHDSHDEVWNGVYVMSPEADNSHQIIVTLLSSAIVESVRNRGILVLSGTNISDQVDDWTRNYRVPDIAVFMPGNPASTISPKAPALNRFPPQT